MKNCEFSDGIVILCDVLVGLLEIKILFPGIVLSGIPVLDYSKYLC